MQSTFNSSTASSSSSSSPSTSSFSSSSSSCCSSRPLSASSSSSSSSSSSCEWVNEEMNVHVVPTPSSSTCSHSPGPTLTHVPTLVSHSTRVMHAVPEESENEWITEFAAAASNNKQTHTRTKHCNKGGDEWEEELEQEHEHEHEQEQEQEQLGVDTKKAHHRCVADKNSTHDQQLKPPPLVRAVTHRHHSASTAPSAAVALSSTPTQQANQNNNKCKKHFFKLFFMMLALFHFCATCNNYQLQRRIQLLEDQLTLFQQQMQMTRAECSAALSMSMQMEREAHAQRANSFVESSVNLFNRLKNMTSSSMLHAWDVAVSVPSSVSWLSSSLSHTPLQLAAIANSATACVRALLPLPPPSDSNSLVNTTSTADQSTIM